MEVPNGGATQAMWDWREYYVPPKRLTPVQKQLLLRFLKSQKDSKLINLRLNEVTEKAIELLMRELDLENKTQVLEVAVLSLALKAPPKTVAEVIRNTASSRGKKKVLKVFDMLV